MRPYLLICITVLVLSACSPAPGSSATGSGIEGQVLIGPTCPVQQVDNPCPDRPYQATLSVLNGLGVQVARFRTGSDGKFQVPLAPGNYTLVPETVNAMTHAPQQAFSVAAGEYTKLAVTYDSGIR